MRIVLTGGGTGGHIIPNIALIEGLKERFRKDGKEEALELLYIGARTGVDRKMVSDAGIPFKGIYCGKLRRYFSFENFIDFLKVPIGVVQAFCIMSKFRPDVIFSKGGFVSVPVVLAGWILGKRIILHESDLMPGLANRIAGRMASDICVSFPETVKFFKGDPHVTGNPVRKQVTSGAKGRGFRLTGFNDELPIVLVMGGSQGASDLNKLVWRNLKRLLPICQIAHITGGGKKGLALEALELDHYAQFDFLEEGLPDLYAVADLVVTRAGANSLAEIAVLKKPSVLVPLGLTVSRGDQIDNAKVFEKKGVSVVLNPAKATADIFFEVVEDLVKHKSKLSEMRKNFEENFEENKAVEKLVELIML